jgi:DNA-binding beta-propeller fold protein YncE
VTNYGSNNVTKLLTSTGATLWTSAAGISEPVGVALDGANIWVANYLSNTVWKLSNWQS